MIKTTNLKKGELYAFSVYGGRLQAGLYWGEGEAGNPQFCPLTENSLQRIEEGKKPYIEYIGGSNIDSRIVQIAPHSLDPDQLDYYNKITKRTA